MNKTSQIVILLMSLVVVIAGSFAFSMTGCTKSDTTPYPYLSSELNELIEAEKQGKADELAQEERMILAGVRLVDTKVLVSITPKEGQLDAAVEAVELLGGSEIAVGKIIAGISAYVPISNLIPLRETESIQAVVLPVMTAQSTDG